LAPVLALERVVRAPASEPVSAAREPESVARAQVLAVEAQEPVLASAARAAV
jgi:hypothetical protein